MYTHPQLIQSTNTLHIPHTTIQKIHLFTFDTLSPNTHKHIQHNLHTNHYLSYSKITYLNLFNKYNALSIENTLHIYECVKHYYILFYFISLHGNVQHLITFKAKYG